MARPKEKAVKLGSANAVGMSEAFANRSQQEQEKLLTKVAKVLSDDLMSLFEEELHYDLVVTNGSCKVKAHHCIIQSRAKHLWQDSWVFPTTDTDGRQMKGIHMSGLTEKQIKDFLRQLYCVTDSELLFEEFLPHLQQHQQLTVNSKETMNCTVSESVTSLGKVEQVQKEEGIQIEIVTSKENDTCSGDADIIIERVEDDDAVDEDCHCKDSQEMVTDLRGTQNRNDINVDVLERDSNNSDLFLREVNSKCRNDGGLSLDHNVSTSNTEKVICSKQSNLPGEDDSHENIPFIETKDDEICSKEAVVESDVLESSHISDVMKDGVIPETGDKQCFPSFTPSGSESVAREDPSDSPSWVEVSACMGDSNNSVHCTSAQISTKEGDQKNQTNDDSTQTSNSTSVVSNPALARVDSSSVGVESIPNDASDVNEESSKSQTTNTSECPTSEASDKAEKVDNVNSCVIVSGDNVCDSQPPTTKKVSFVNPYNTCSSLGSDLLLLYLQQQQCDCCLSVEDTQFLVHKCVLSARSSYFSAMFGGQWSESSLEVVQLEGVSSSAMEKVLFFFYGGVIDIISSTDIVDLFVIADMYGVETMKLVLQYFLKRDMCHFFHKPCSTCISRTPDALALCNNFFLEELQDRLLKWISKYFTKIWCTKTFASLPEALHQLCVETIVKQMTEVNVLDIIIDCEKLTTSLPRIKWTESVLCMTTQLMDLAIEYTSTNFIKVIHSPEFLTWATVAAWKASALEEIFNSVIDSLPVDMAISVYRTLVDLRASVDKSNSPDQNLLELLDTMIKRCNKFLRTHILQVTRCKEWSSLSKSFQSQILESSSYVHLDQFPDPKPRPKKPVMFSTLAKHRPSSSSSSASSISSVRQPSQRGATSAPGQKPSSRVKTSVTTSKGVDASNTFDKKKPVASSMLSKSLKSDVKPKSKVTPKSFSEDSNSAVHNPKASKPKVEATLKDNKTSHVSHLPRSSKSKPEHIKSSERLSSSLPSGRHSPRLSTSPSSRIPLKSTPVKTQLSSHDKTLPFSLQKTNAAETAGLSVQGSSSQSVSKEFPPVLSVGTNHCSVGFIPSSEPTEGRDIVGLIEKASDSAPSAKFESSVTDGCTNSSQGPRETLPENGHPDNLAVISPHLNGEENLSETALGHGLENEAETNQTRESADTFQTLHFQATGNDESESQVPVQRETNFVKTSHSQSVQVSFVVPTNSEDDPS